MKSRKVYGGLGAVVLLAVFMLAGSVGAGDIANTVGSACTKCHSSKRICLNLGAKSKNLWKVTVTNMVRKGAKLPADQIDAAADYLAGLKPGQDPICQ